MHPGPDPLDNTSAGSPDEQAVASDGEFALAQGNLGNRCFVLRKFHKMSFA